MNKAELIDAVAAASRLNKSEATRAVDAVLSSIKNELAIGGEVALVGFGRFMVRYREEREGHNPATGEKITIAARYVPAFRAGKGLRDLVNGIE